MKSCILCEKSDFFLKDYFNNFKKKITKIFIYKFYLNKILKILSKKLYSKLTSGEEIFLFKKVLICKNCNLGSVYPFIDDKTLEYYYSRNYWLDHRNITEVERVINEKEAEIFLNKSNFLKKYTNFEDKTFAEFGCGRGVFANEVLNNKKVKLYNAIELSEVSIPKKLLLNKSFKSVKSLDFIKENSIDIFIMIQSIEHLSNINIFFQKLKKKLKQKSLILIETPNYNKQYFNYRSGWTPHTLFFNVKSIKYLANKFNFEIIDLQLIDCSWSELNCGVKKEADEEAHNLRVLLRN